MVLFSFSKISFIFHELHHFLMIFKTILQIFTKLELATLMPRLTNMNIWVLLGSYKNYFIFHGLFMNDPCTATKGFLWRFFQLFNELKLGTSVLKPLISTFQYSLVSLKCCLTFLKLFTMGCHTTFAGS